MKELIRLDEKPHKLSHLVKSHDIQSYAEIGKPVKLSRREDKDEETCHVTNPGSHSK